MDGRRPPPPIPEAQQVPAPLPLIIRHNARGGGGRPMPSHQRRPKLRCAPHCCSASRPGDCMVLLSEREAPAGGRHRFRLPVAR